MKQWFSRMMPKLFLFIAPFVKWFDHFFTVPYSMKLITGDHYFIWKPRFKKGMAFVTDIYGQGSNLINPSQGKHCAIYFGKGLKSFIEARIEADSSNLTPEFLSYYEKHKGSLNDDIEYVIESVGKGVVATSVITFLTRKDVVRGFTPLFCDESKMHLSAEIAVLDLGKKYDYSFADGGDARYCFEVTIDAYKLACPEYVPYAEDYFGFKVYLATVFKDDGVWRRVIDSKAEFPELYEK